MVDIVDVLFWAAVVAGIGFLIRAGVLFVEERLLRRELDELFGRRGR